jgi:hypothetical protein
MGWSSPTLYILFHCFQAFENISIQCGVKCSSTPGSPQKLTGSKQNLSDEDVQDIVKYLCDACETLHAFLEIYPKAALIFHEQTVEVR